LGGLTPKALARTAAIAHRAAASPPTTPLPLPLLPLRCPLGTSWTPTSLLPPAAGLATAGLPTARWSPNVPPVLLPPVRFLPVRRPLGALPRSLDKRNLMMTAASPLQTTATAKTVAPDASPARQPRSGWAVLATPIW
jgi:hypothetical protein